MSKKRAIAIIEKGTNYFFHIQAASRINYDSSYSELYKDSVFEEDLNYLKENEKLFLFGNGRPFSLLTDTYLFTPASLNLDTEVKLAEYFELLAFCIRNGDIKELYERYAETYEKVEMLLGKGYYERLKDNIKSIQSECAERAIKIADIMKRNFDRYNNYVWTSEKTKLEACVNRLNTELGKLDIIGKLETFLGLEYKTELFQVTLCSANCNGPDCNDLGYDKNLHFYGSIFTYLLRLIQHEICIRMLLPLRQLHSEYDSYILYDAFESLAKFYNYKVFGSNPPYNDEYKFFNIYERIWTSIGNLPPEELIKEGFKEYVRLP